MNTPRLTALRGVLIAGAMALAACQSPAVAAETAVNAPVPTRQAREGEGLKTAIFAGGCFWGVEAVFSHVKGVKSAVSGYHGGAAGNATYDQVSTGTTNHAEAVRVVYDPSVVRYDQLLQIFFSVVADPTLRNRQGPDTGPQYRAALVPLNREQSTVATAYLTQMSNSDVWSRPIVTRVETARRFFPAESNHQDFAKRNPNNPYILRWDAPKVAALRRMFPTFYSDTFQTG